MSESNIEQSTEKDKEKEFTKINNSSLTSNAKRSKTKKSKKMKKKRKYSRLKKKSSSTKNKKRKFQISIFLIALGILVSLLLFFGIFEIITINKTQKIRTEEEYDYPTNFFTGDYNQTLKEEKNKTYEIGLKKKRNLK